MLLSGPEVVAHGLVTGIPWSIHAWTTAPAPEAKWWDVMQAVGPEMEFRLGAHGFLGGGGINVLVPEGHAFTAKGSFFGRVPHVISWAGVVTDGVERLAACPRRSWRPIGPAKSLSDGPCRSRRSRRTRTPVPP